MGAVEHGDWTVVIQLIKSGSRYAEAGGEFSQRGRHSPTETLGTDSGQVHVRVGIDEEANQVIEAATDRTSPRARGFGTRRDPNGANRFFVSLEDGLGVLGREAFDQPRFQRATLQLQRLSECWPSAGHVDLKLIGHVFHRPYSAS
ncbi:hypothetical protein CFN78_25535 [Amycolatopsis antarctica]|uniref:Uncharacterized protein n=1 Tax=Amycolatopsis antarctica TaxID=1854586 RepID=A0A263CYW8_9PSEU|nr:hypothetical protein CFN78_25535 [Amycolatopsis antarctica]